MNSLEKSKAVPFHFSDVSKVYVVDRNFSGTEYLMNNHSVEPHVSGGHTAHLTRTDIGVRKTVPLFNLCAGVTAPEFRTHQVHS